MPLSDLELIQEIQDLEPVFSRNFAANPVLNPEIADEITFTRASTSTRTNELGLIADAGVDVPRFDYTPNLRTNRILYSQEFNNAAWTKDGGFITQDSTNAPDLTTTADKLYENTGAGVGHRVYQAVGPTNGVASTASVYAKASERAFVWIQLVDGSVTRRRYTVIADLTNGVAKFLAEEGSPTLTGFSITSVGSGWYRLTASMNYVSNSTTSYVTIGIADSYSPTLNGAEEPIYNGDGTSGIFIWGAQLEIGAVSPYQATPNTIAGPVCKGLLIEESRTNLLTYSEDFTNAAWNDAQNRALRISSTGVGDPAGGTTAATYKNNGLGNDLVFRLISSTPGTTYTYSIWARRRLGTGEVRMVVGRLENNFVIPVTDQWARYSVTGLASDTTGRAYVLIHGVNDEIDIWGAQLEVGAFPTSYIRTTSAAVTRAQDVCSVTGTNFSRWYRQDEGAFYAECLGVGGPSGISPLGLIPSATALAASSNGLNLVSDAFGSLVTVNATIDSRTFFSKFARCVRFAANDSVIVKDGVSNTQTAPITSLAITGLSVGNRGNGLVASGQITIRSIAYHPKRLSNRLLKAITLP